MDSKMSAIQRDREIAAKATKGRWHVRLGPSVWSTFEIDDPDNLDEQKRRNHHPICELNSMVRDRVDYDAEHIVRLHNRQPLYDALVDAVRQCIDQSMENGHGIPPYGVWMYECLAALDPEER